MAEQSDKSSQLGKKPETKNTYVTEVLPSSHATSLVEATRDIRSIKVEGSSESSAALELVYLQEKGEDESSIEDNESIDFNNATDQGRSDEESVFLDAVSEPISDDRSDATYPIKRGIPSVSSLEDINIEDIAEAGNISPSGDSVEFNLTEVLSPETNDKGDLVHERECTEGHKDESSSNVINISESAAKELREPNVVRATEQAEYLEGEDLAVHRTSEADRQLESALIKKPNEDEEPLANGASQINASTEFHTVMVSPASTVDMDVSSQDGRPSDPSTKGDHGTSAMDISIGQQLEDVNVPHNAILGLSMVAPNKAHCPELTFKDATDVGELTRLQSDTYETPLKRTTAIVDSRTITRPSKRPQTVPEAVVVSTAKGDAVEPPVTASTDMKPSSVTSSAEATARSETNPADLPVVKPSSSADQPRREDMKTSHRARQRTVTVQSQISMEIANAVNAVKQMGIEDPLTEVERRVQAVVAAKEKEWAAKTEKLTQMLIHEQKRNDPLEAKAVERLAAINEYEKLVKNLADALKQNTMKSGVKTSESKLSSVRSFGGPGPERTISPDDVALLMKERDQLADDVNSLETSYGDLFRRYEKLRQASIEIKKNEENAKKALEEMSRRNGTLGEKLEMLRQNAEEQLDLANEEIERLNKQRETDTLALRLKVKHLETKVEALNITLQSKNKEIEELTHLFQVVIDKAEANAEEGAD